jgi:hypothetical protein
MVLTGAYDEIDIPAIGTVRNFVCGWA